ncbi:MAG TPA: hypothetical protein VIF02_00425 [Methylocella sp.]
MAILGHNFWSGGALVTIVVTLIGWLVALRRVARLDTPQKKSVQFYEALHFERRYYFATAITGARPLSDGRRLCGMSGKVLVT